MNEFTKLSSKGQVVIPMSIRKDMNLQEGTPFIVIESEDSVILKKVELPKIKSWKGVSRPFGEAARKARFSQDDLRRIIAEVRAAKR